MVRVSLSILSLVVLAISFVSVLSATAFLEKPIEFKPPYYYAPGDLIGVINAFFFVFFFSLLFFGYSAPMAMTVEGVKYASYYASGAASAVDVAFALPAFFACLSAISLGHGALRDLRGEGSIFDEWGNATKFFLAGIALLGLLLVAKRFIG